MEEKEKCELCGKEGSVFISYYDNYFEGFSELYLMCDDCTKDIMEYIESKKKTKDNPNQLNLF